MSDTSSLTELARFVGQSPLVGDNESGGRQVVNGTVPGRRVARQKVSDLLSVVLTLSARTRRMILPKVEIDLDVFGPNGKRAVRLILP